jgi:hypothetical protein
MKEYPFDCLSFGLIKNVPAIPMVLGVSMESLFAIVDFFRSLISVRMQSLPYSQCGILQPGGRSPLPRGRWKIGGVRFFRSNLKEKV